jgi:hypothetical protein
MSSTRKVCSRYVVLCKFKVKKKCNQAMVSLGTLGCNVVGSQSNDVLIK